MTELRPFHSFFLLQHVCIPYYNPPFLSLFLPELCIYIVTVVHVLEYIYAIVRPKLSSMYRDHRFLYVEPSSVYLHLYGTIYTVFMPLWCLFRILFYCYISDYPYACEEFWIVALSLHLRYQVLLIFKKYESVKMKVKGWCFVYYHCIKRKRSLQDSWNAWWTQFNLTCYLLINLQHQLITIIIIINPEFVEALFTLMQEFSLCVISLQKVNIW